MTSRARTVFEVRETKSHSALRQWARRFGVPIHHLGSDTEGHEVYGAMLGPHLRVCRTEPERLHPVRWVSPLEHLPRPRKAAVMPTCPGWCENDHEADPALNLIRHIRLLHDQIGHPVTVYVERDDPVSGPPGKPVSCLVYWRLGTNASPSVDPARCP
ncbi:hypothetical protein SUDANB121_00008 [Nocardiopsis dassonvillei]